MTGKWRLTPAPNSSSRAVVETEGNPACHVILRGANSGPNYEVEHVKKAAEGLKKAGVSTRVMIDWYVRPSPYRELRVRHPGPT